MDYETLRNSMTLQDAIQVFRDTNAYGTMDIAKSVILKALEQQPKERTEEGTETHACDYISRKLMMDMGATCIAARNEDGDLVALGALDILPSVSTKPQTDKALNLLAEWVIECGFGYDNIPEEYEKYKGDIVEMGYREGLVYIVKMESEAKK